MTSTFGAGTLARSTGWVGTAAEQAQRNMLPHTAQNPRFRTMRPPRLMEGHAHTDEDHASDREVDADEVGDQLLVLVRARQLPLGEVAHQERLAGAGPVERHPAALRPRGA